MKHFTLLACLLVLSMIVAVSAAFAEKPDRAIWWELESVRTDFGSDFSLADMVSSMEKAKTLTLRQGKFPLSLNDKGDLFPVDNARVWIKNPDGVVSEVNTFSKNGPIVLKLPSDLAPGNLTGCYLVGIHLDAGVMDFDSDGTDERVHLYSNYFVRYHKDGGTKSEKLNTFFNEPNKIALEIAPLVVKGILKNAGYPGSGAMKKGKKGAGYVMPDEFQMPLKECKMKVNYRGRPLADAEVIILSKSGWQKTVMTNSEGILTITLPKTKMSPLVSDLIAMTLSNGKKQEDFSALVKMMERGDFSAMGNMMGKGCPSGMGGMMGKGGSSGMGGMMGRGGSSGMGGMKGKGMNKFRHKAEDKAGHVGQGMSENVKQMMAKKFDGASFEDIFGMEDKLLYMVAHKDASTGEYHCATLPRSLLTMDLGGTSQNK